MPFRHDIADRFGKTLKGVIGCFVADCDPSGVLEEFAQPPPQFVSSYEAQSSPVVLVKIVARLDHETEPHRNESGGFQRLRLET